jgi:AraC-like DNA-binding protein
MEELRGILNGRAGEKKFCLKRYLPAQDLSFFVERYWTVNWDLREQEPFVQEVLPYPCVHLVFEEKRSRVYGVETGRFTRLLEDKGRVFSIKFRPGGFYPFVQVPITHFTCTSIELEEVFGNNARRVEEEVLEQKDEMEMKEVVESFLRERLPEQDENVLQVNRVVDYIVEHREVTRVEDVMKALGLNKRRVQRLFSRYVGVSPKWVISRYRIHEAAERVAEGFGIDWTGLALDLGYFDQAHFIKDFKAMVGRTPREYARTVQGNGVVN